MRRSSKRILFGLILAGTLVLGPALRLGHARTQETAQQQQQGSPKLTFEGDTALWSIAVHPAKTAEFEQFLEKLREAFSKSESEERKRQGAGWKVMRGAAPLPNGNIVYTHILSPVVPGADYRPLEILYEVFKDPTEQKALYDLYRGAFAGNVGAGVGSIVADMSKPPAVAGQ